MDGVEIVGFREGHRGSFLRLCSLYFAELGQVWDDETLERVVSHLISLQENCKCFINLCSRQGSMVGFIIAQVDEEGHSLCLKPGYGFVRELYVMEECRRMGYGKGLYLAAEESLKQYGVEAVYLTATPSAGEAFWESMGFVFTGEIHYENGHRIYEKAVVR